MTTPFDALAHSYNALWSETARGRDQRTAVWREIDGLFRPGDRVLDLGCGTGDDALHLAGLGVEVFGIDASAQMVEIARSRDVRCVIAWRSRIYRTVSGAASPEQSRISARSTAWQIWCR